MKKFGKIFGISGVVLMSAAVLTGCGDVGKKNSGSKDSGSGDSKDAVTIRMSWWGNDDRHKATLDAIEKFESANPEIKVKAEYSGWDGIVEKMATQIAGGTNPDLMQINYDWYQTYSPDGEGFADLNEYKDIIDLSGYTEDTLSAANINGKLNGIPHGENAYVFATNKTKYEEFGVNPDDLKTWDDYKEAAKKFPDGYYPMSFKSFNEPMIYLTQKYGKAMLDEEGNMNYTADQIAEGLKWYQEMIDAKVVPSVKTMVETVGTAHLSTVKQFIEGQYDGIYDWTGGLASYQSVLKEGNMDLTIPTYPTIEEGQAAGVIKKPTMLFSISKNTKYPKETAKLLNFLLNDPEGVKAMGTARGLPINTNAVKILEDAGLVDEISKTASEFVKNTEGVMESPFYEMSQVVEAYNVPFEQFGLGEMTPEEAGKQIVKNVEAAVKQIKAQ